MGGGVLFNIWPMGGVLFNKAYGGAYCLIYGRWGGGVLFNIWLMGGGRIV